MLVMLPRVPFGADSDHRAQSARRRQPARGPAVLGGWRLLGDHWL